MIILAIDPGSSRAQVSHTGIVLLSGTTLLDSWAVDSGVTGFSAWARHHVSLRGGPPYGVRNSQDKWVDVDVVVCEQFVDRQVMGADRSPLKIEGVVQFLWPDVVLQPASGYIQAVPDEILKKLNLWDFGRDHHQDRRSAARHAIRFQKNQLVPEVLTAFR